MGHLFYATSSFVYHFVPIGEIKLELQSGNTQFGSNSTIFRAVQPWNLMDDLENKANLRDLIAATDLIILLKFDPNHRFFVPCDLEIWWMTLENNRVPLLYCIKLCLSFQSNPLVNGNWSYSPETLNSGQNWRFFVLCDLEIWWMTLENNRAPLLYYIKLCASFHSH